IDGLLKLLGGLGPGFPVHRFPADLIEPCSALDIASRSLRRHRRVPKEQRGNETDGGNDVFHDPAWVDRNAIEANEKRPASREPAGRKEKRMRFRRLEPEPHT